MAKEVELQEVERDDEEASSAVRCRRCPFLTQTYGCNRHRRKQQRDKNWSLERQVAALLSLQLFAVRSGELKTIIFALRNHP